ncbi:NADH-quinone oxidoreductase subunit NuoK [Salinicola rhizosphaerae]|uniref:NADH-quinone oxidoreductase subunit K n=1 Tax=Salinicola rhizosphaerae TaxID=1443141 RepID=A0ABQ3DQU8_9GAMM|nr:NADH-quinone oxidoreductase subunit NuoK [Salinicola rhizosphaerae]GHB12403.1 NADH-quinone oxidoreductase subunit K [Salinicola rhizosphaerae]
MNGIPMEHGLILAAILFVLGLGGLMTRRNMVFVLMSLEIMMNAAGLAFIVGGTHWQQADGQVMFLMIITLAAAEASVGLALLMQLYRRFKTLDIDAASRLRG